jgi:hypothetical protein
MSSVSFICGGYNRPLVRTEVPPVISISLATRNILSARKIKMCRVEVLSCPATASAKVIQKATIETRSIRLVVTNVKSGYKAAHLTHLLPGVTKIGARVQSH